MSRRKKKEPLQFVVSIPDLRGSDPDWDAITATLLAAYIKDAVEGWAGQFEPDHPMFSRPGLKDGITVQTMNRYLARHIGALQLA